MRIIQFPDFFKIVEKSYKGNVGKQKDAKILLWSIINSIGTSDQLFDELLEEAKINASRSADLAKKSFKWNAKDLNLKNSFSKGKGSAQKAAAFHFLFLCEKKHSEYAKKMNAKIGLEQLIGKNVESVQFGNKRQMEIETETIRSIPNTKSSAEQISNIQNSGENILLAKLDKLSSAIAQFVDSKLRRELDQFAHDITQNKFEIDYEEHGMKFFELAALCGDEFVKIYRTHRYYLSQNRQKRIDDAKRKITDLSNVVFRYINHQSSLIDDQLDKHGEKLLQESKSALPNALFKIIDLVNMIPSEFEEELSEINSDIEKRISRKPDVSISQTLNKSKLLDNFKKRFAECNLDNSFDTLISGEGIISKIMGYDYYEELHKGYSLVMLEQAYAMQAKENGDTAKYEVHLNSANKLLRTLKQRIDGIPDT